MIELLELLRDVPESRSICVVPGYHKQVDTNSPRCPVLASLVHQKQWLNSTGFIRLRIRLTCHFSEIPYLA